MAYRRKLLKSTKNRGHKTNLSPSLPRAYRIQLQAILTIQVGILLRCAQCYFFLFSIHWLHEWQSIYVHSPICFAVFSLLSLIYITSQWPIFSVFQLYIKLKLGHSLLLLTFSYFLVIVNMHLYYYIGEDGKRVYTLKVC